jgi:hypothetical protein
MLDATNIKTLVTRLETEYQQEGDPIEAQLIAKIATIETGGWTEECIDQILKSYIDSVNPDCKNELIKKIDENYGLHYKSNFRNLCIQILGAILFERIEKQIMLESQQLESSLNGLTGNRNRCAHTFVNMQTIIDAPNKTLEHLRHIEATLPKFEEEFARIGI